jgi:hypothetical protein
LVPPVAADEEVAVMVALRCPVQEGMLWALHARAACGAGGILQSRKQKQTVVLQEHCVNWVLFCSAFSLPDKVAKLSSLVAEHIKIFSKITMIKYKV